MGGRFLLALLWLVLAGWIYSHPVSADPSYDAVVRAWGLILAAAFGLVSMVSPGLRFFPRAMASVALTFSVVGALLVARPNALSRFTETVSDSLRQRSTDALSAWNQWAAASPRWQKFESESQDALNHSAIYAKVTNGAAKVLPPAGAALLALESLAALALAWGLYHRASRTRLGPPLELLRDFRFNDQLVWGLIAGAAFVVLPALASLRGVGVNLLAFFGALYLLRGLGVLTWFLAPRRIGLALIVLFAIVSWPITLGLGLGDTWFDLRGRARTTS